MLNAILLLILSTFALAQEDHATISAQRWNGKLVITIDHDKGWHTYWKNPGDAGIASSFKFSQNEKPVTPKAHEWPLPKRYIEAGDILTIGYSGTDHFFFDDVKGALDIHVGVLICKDICIPGEAKLKLAASEMWKANRDAPPYSPESLNKALEKLPKDAAIPTGFEFYLTRVKEKNQLTLHYSLKGVTGPKPTYELPLLTAFPHPPFGYKRESQYFKDGTLYGKLDIEWDGEYQEPPVALPENGEFPKPFHLRFLLNVPGQDIGVVTLPVKNFSVATPALDVFYKGLGTVSGDSKKNLSSASNETSFLEYLLFAFLGGLILNLMPCVLPVISLKLFGLIKHREYSQKRLFQHNLSYSLGVISTFMVLAGVIAGIKAGGEEIGWGFQLQSPAFILVMMLILFILSLNLFGLFEFMTPGGSSLGGKEPEESFIGDFLGGVLTTILSTPCSAPFLGTALTFAFTTTTSMIFVMFFFIGLGLAFPFIMTAVFPKSLTLFPKPGMWMVKLKYFLGFTLIVTIIWLYDVFVSLVNFDVISWRLNLLFALWFFAFFFGQKISKNRIAQLLVMAIPVVLTVFAIKNIQLRSVEASSMKLEGQWKPWTREAMQAEVGKPVFVDFTAEWCLTCKVNKKLVLETDTFTEMAKKNNVTLMRADWTKRDDHITRFLKEHGAVGVPAYFVQKASGEMIFLGETVSTSKVEEALR